MAHLLLSFCRWLETTPPAAALRDSVWVFNLTETVHTLGIIFVAGTIMLVDLRLLGMGLRAEPVSHVVSRIVPWTLAGLDRENYYSAEAIVKGWDIPYAPRWQKNRGKTAERHLFLSTDKDQLIRVAPYH